MDAAKKKKLVPALIMFGWILFFGLWGATQNLAERVEYDRLLGSWWFVWGNTPIYGPFRFIEWWFAFGDVIPKLFEAASNWLYGSFMVGMFAFGMVMKKGKVLDSHGSASWATKEEVLQMGLTDGNGVIIGRNPFVKPEEGKGFLQHNGKEHIILMAPTRSGKGVGCIIPTLLTWKHSVFVTDIKGENWEVTSKYRQKYLGSKVLKFEPTCFDGSSAKYNPLAEIRFRTINEMRDVQNIADMLVDPDGKGQMDHWAKTGHALLVGVVTHLMYVWKHEGRGIPSLSDVASFLSRPDMTFEESLVEMKRYPHISVEEALSDDNVFEKIYGKWYVKNLQEIKKNPPKVIDQRTGKDCGIDVDHEYIAGSDEAPGILTHPKVAEAAAELINKSDNERSGVLSTAMSFLGLYRDPVVAFNTSESDFHVEDLLREDMIVSLYLVIVPSDISRLMPLVRMILNMLIRRLLEKMEFKNGQQVEKKNRLLLLLDEFPALGNLDSMEKGLAFIAGYGIKAFLIVQSLNQLNKIYTKDNSIVDNCHLQIYYTPNDSETPGFISKLLGKKTIEVTNHSGKVGAIFDSSQSTSQIGRELLTPEEVKKLPKEKEVVFVSGYAPILADKLVYHKEKYFKERCMDSPKVSDKIS